MLFSTVFGSGRSQAGQAPGALLVRKMNPYWVFRYLFSKRTVPSRHDGGYTPTVLKNDESAGEKVTVRPSGETPCTVRSSRRR